MHKGQATKAVREDTKAERRKGQSGGGMEKATETFLKCQQEAEARFLKWKEQWHKEMEMEDR